MRDTIILAGGYRLDVRNASAIRALGLAHIFLSLGYRVIVMGKFSVAPEGARSQGGVLIDGVSCRDIQQPIADQICASYIKSSEPVMQLVDEAGAERVRAVLCYNYPARGAWLTIRRTRQLGIAPILDCTEWYGWEGKKILRNILRVAGVEMRMRVLTRLAGNVICVSSWFRARIAGSHTMLLPFVLDTDRPEWQRAQAPDSTDPAHLVYSGSPGLGMHKDRLPVMIAALSRLADEGHDFRISVAGVTEQQYLGMVPEHQREVQALQGRLRFLGRIPHAESLALLRSADFSVFFRKPNRVSNTGFATKYVEAATLGVPVISNPTSDIPRYLRDGENGILARSIAAADVADALRRAITMTSEQRAAMVAVCRAENPFDMRLWQHDVHTFLENLRGCDD